MWKGERRGTSHNDIFYNDATAFFLKPQVRTTCGLFVIAVV